MNSPKNYGACCICEAETADVQNIIMLDYKTRSESVWGCYVCWLPFEGAVACVCDTCIEKYDNVEAEIKFLMDSHRRIPVPPVEERVLHQHNLSLHPEPHPATKKEKTTDASSHHS